MRTRRKLSKNDADEMENIVRRYFCDKCELDNQRLDIVLATPFFDRNGGGKSNLPGRPTEKTAIRLIEYDKKNDAKIRRINAVTLALSQLTEEKQRFIHTLYWSGIRRTYADMADEFSISIRTFYRWKEEFLYNVWKILNN